MAKALAKIPGLAKQSWTYTRPRLSRFLECAKVELTPPMPGEFGQVTQGLNKIIAGARTGRWKELTVKESFVNSLVVADVVFCFFIGEIIGKGKIVGYDIDGATYWAAGAYLS